MLRDKVRTSVCLLLAVTGLLLGWGPYTLSGRDGGVGLPRGLRLENGATASGIRSESVSPTHVNNDPIFVPIRKLLSIVETTPSWRYLPIRKDFVVRESYATFSRVWFPRLWTFYLEHWEWVRNENDRFSLQSLYFNVDICSLKQADVFNDFLKGYVSIVVWNRQFKLFKDDSCPRLSALVLHLLPGDFTESLHIRSLFLIEPDQLVRLFRSGCIVAPRLDELRKGCEGDYRRENYHPSFARLDAIKNVFFASCYASAGVFCFYEGFCFLIFFDFSGSIHARWFDLFGDGCFGSTKRLWCGTALILGGIGFATLIVHIIHWQ